MLSQVQSQLKALEPLLGGRVTQNIWEPTSAQSLSLSSSPISFGSGSYPGARFFVGGEISSQDYALSIDHILEQILSSLDIKSLFRCRFVSHKWRSVSTKLIKRNRFHYLCFEYNPTHQVYVQHWDVSRIYSPKFTLPKLTSFLKTTYSDGDNADADAGSGRWSMDTFPANKFTILRGTLDIPQLQSFLNVFGEHLQNLCLDFLGFPRPQEAEAFDEAALMKSVETLLSYQAPNLGKLTLWANLKKSNTEGNEDTGSNIELSGLPQSDQSDSGESKDITNRRKKNKLNKLNFEVLSSKILEMIISISPHLQSIELRYPLFHFLIKPVNRLHLLRQFIIHANRNPNFNFENIQMIQDALSPMAQRERQIQNLPPTKFTKLGISFLEIDKFVSNSEDIRLCFVEVINKILECSWDTLEYISFESYIGDTLRGIKWPVVLPKVTKLVLCPTTASGLDVFPSHENFYIQHTFPKLKDLCFDLEATYSVSFSAVKHLRKRNFGLVPSASSVSVNMLVNQIPYSRRYMNIMTDVWLAREYHFLRNEVENLFPNAKTILEIFL